MWLFFLWRVCSLFFVSYRFENFGLIPYTKCWKIFKLSRCSTTSILHSMSVPWKKKKKKNLNATADPQLCNCNTIFSMINPVFLQAFAEKREHWGLYSYLAHTCSSRSNTWSGFSSFSRSQVGLAIRVIVLGEWFQMNRLYSLFPNHPLLRTFHSYLGYYIFDSKA